MSTTHFSGGSLLKFMAIKNAKKDEQWSIDATCRENGWNIGDGAFMEHG